MDGQAVNVVAYARISSADQSEDGQADALRRAGASRLVVERASGVAERPLLDELISGLRGGDALAVTEVSRLGRTVHEILLLADDLRRRGVHLRILNLGIDSVTPAGELVLTLMAGLAKFERDLLRERQRRGIEAARKRGKHLGRPPVLTASHAETAISRLQTESLAVIPPDDLREELPLPRIGPREFCLSRTYRVPVNLGHGLVHRLRKCHRNNPEPAGRTSTSSESRASTYPRTRP